MLTKKRFRSAWVVTVGAGALVGACGGTTSTGTETDGGGDGGNPAGCPASPPTVGGACALPSSQSCNYGNSCSPTTYECNGGTWSVFHGNPPAPTCPASPPSGSCACYPANFMCSYAMGTCNGQPNPEIVVCSGGQWAVQISTCNPPAPDSGLADAPSDGSAHDATLD